MSVHLVATVAGAPVAVEEGQRPLDVFNHPYVYVASPRTR